MSRSSSRQLYPYPSPTQAKKPRYCLGQAVLYINAQRSMSANSKLVGVSSDGKKLEKKPVKFSNLLLGAGMNLFEVTTLGQPLEVMKTTMAANRKDGMAGAISRIWSRGGFFGCEYTLLCIVKSVNNRPQSIRVSFHGHGSRLLPRALCSSSWLPRLNTTPRPSAPTTLSLVSLEA